MRLVRVAAVQDSPVLLDRAATLDLVDELVDRAAGQGAHLIALPEAFVPGPPVWIDAVAVGEDGDWHARLTRERVSVPGEASDRPRRQRDAPEPSWWSGSTSASRTAARSTTPSSRSARTDRSWESTAS